MHQETQSCHSIMIIQLTNVNLPNSYLKLKCIHVFNIERLIYILLFDKIGMIIVNHNTSRYVYHKSRFHLSITKLYLIEYFIDSVQ